MLSGTLPAQIANDYNVDIPSVPAARGTPVGPDGAVWFTEEVGNRIGRITTPGAATEFSAGISPGAVNPLTWAPAKTVDTCGVSNLPKFSS